jgi:hypothetical protein
MTNRLIQHTDPVGIFEDLSFDDLVATMETLAESGQIEFTVIAHGRIEPDGTD